jgi:hypothetical protein
MRTLEMEKLKAFIKSLKAVSKELINNNVKMY